MPRKRSPRVLGRTITARLVGVTARDAYVAILDPFAGRRHMYTLWRLRLGSHGDSEVLGREIDLPLCRRIVRERKP